MPPRRGQAGHVGRRHRRRRRLLYGPAVAAGRAARAGCSPRTSSPRRSRRARPARPARAARQCRGQARPAQRSAASRRLVRPHLHDPHVSRDRAALRVPVESARRAEERRPGDRRRRRPADRPPRHAAAPAGLRVQRGRLRAHPLRAAARQRILFRPVRGARPAPRARATSRPASPEPQEQGPQSSPNSRKLRHSPPAKIR